jgi:long-chain acyl-CoA synthetase
MHDIEGIAFSTLSELIRSHARQSPERAALIQGERRIDYAALDRRMDRIAAALQHQGLLPGDTIAICAGASVDYAAVFLGALRAGVVVAPLAPGATVTSLQCMLDDAQARLLFVDAVAGLASGPVTQDDVPRVSLGQVGEGLTLEEWLAGAPARPPAAVDLQAQSPFNIIYSSGTTGEPKGIVQSHGMRWSHVQRGARYGYGPRSVTLLATPLYSNTTLVVFAPTLAFGGTVVLMPRFDVEGYLHMAQIHRATHTMLVPVQYQRLMASAGFDAHDLSSFEYKFCTSAPFPAKLKAEVLRRWPGALVEFYGMTEGGGTCILEAHRFPAKLHTVGRPADGHDIRLIDEAGKEVRSGEPGEVVGRSAGMMTGYHRRPDLTREAEWHDARGQRFIRTGDVGRFDEEGFLTLLDRKKDMIISGGFNIYPSDLEAALREHAAVADVAVVGVPSLQWGESPVAFVVRRHDGNVRADDLLHWANARLGRTQRLSGLRFIEELPRSAIGKVLKTELRDLAVRTPAGRGDGA